MNPLKNADHLLRVALVFAAGFAAFLGLRAAIVPKSFGQYGHYRGAAIDEIAAKTPAFAGHEACEACHQDQADLKKAGKHANIACEACHGPLGRHAEDPASLTPVRPDTAVLCVRCHEANAAKPRSFPQVESQQHSGGVPCGTCHQPHKPGIS